MRCQTVESDLEQKSTESKTLEEQLEKLKTTNLAAQDDLRSTLHKEHEKTQGDLQLYHENKLHDLQEAHEAEIAELKAEIERLSGLTFAQVLRHMKEEFEKDKGVAVEKAVAE